MKEKALFTLRELLVVIFSGGIPIVIAYKLGGQKEMESVLKGLLAPKIFLYYCAAMVLPFGVLYFADRNIYIDPLSNKKKFVNFIISTLYELSSNIVGIFRVVAGILITMPFLALAVEPESFLKLFIGFIPLGVMAYLEVVVFYWWFSGAEIKKIL